YFTDPNFRDLSNPASVDVKEENLCSCDKAGTITVTISVAYPLSDNELRDVKVTIDGRKAPINSTDKNTSATKGKTLEICPSGLQSGTIDVEMSSSGGSIEIADDPGNNNPGTKL